VDVSRRRLRAVLDDHGVTARRALGQNFLVDPGVARRIVEVAGVAPGDLVIEVGPGAGALTLALLEAGAEVLALEKDPAMAEILAEVTADEAPGSLEVVLGDATRVDWAELVGTRPAAAVANLPYNVAVPIILSLLGGAPTVDPLTVMVQDEVADRLCARPGGRTIGVPTVKVGWWASARRLMTVPPTVFLPQPRVTSAVVQLRRRPPPSTRIDPTHVFPLVERAYRQRRKMLRSSLTGVPPEAFAEAGIDPTERPERLDVGSWASLAAALRSAPSPPA